MPTYVITGASSGIGLDMVQTLAARGDKVYALVRTKAGSKSAEDEISKVKGDVTVIEGIDVASDDVGKALAASSLADVKIDVLVNNAGVSGDFGAAQKLENIEMDNMRKCFEINTLGPLRITKALMGQLATPGGKVAVISTGMGSISDNGSGGMYAYRTSKAAVNMVTKSLAMDLKGKEVWVAAIAPGFIVTDFGPGREAMASMGGKPVAQATKGILETIDKMSMDNTGSFMMVPSDGGTPKPYEW
jgi:tubulin alpha